MIGVLTLALLLSATVPALVHTEQAGGTLRGVVVLEQTGDAMPGAVVRVAGQSTSTDAQGAFEVAVLAAGEHIVRVDAAAIGRSIARRVRITDGAVTRVDLILPLPAVHEEVMVEGLDVRTLLPSGLGGTPGAAASLDARDLQQYRPYSLHDALPFLPGVRTIDDDALGRRSGIGVRGAPPRRSRRILLLEDGVPINAATYLDPSTHYTPPLERLARIDVLKGAGQIVHGPLNNHGIINFRTTRPTVTPETIAEGAAGTMGTVRRHVQHTRTVGPAGLVLAYTGMNADGVFDTESHQYDDLFGSGTWAINPSHEIGGSVTWFRERSHYDERNLSLAEYARDPRSKRQLDEGAEFNTMAVNYVKGHLTHRGRIGSGVTIASHVFATDLDRPRFESRRGGPGAAGGYMRGRERRYTTIGGESRAEWLGPAAGAAVMTLEAGLRSERQAFDNLSTVGAIGTILTPGSRGVLAAQDGESYAEDARAESLEAWAWSGYVRNEAAFGRVTLTSGLRVERYTQSRTLEFRPGTVTPARESDKRTLWLPGAGLRYALAAGTHLYAGVHRGYSPAIARTEDFPLVPETGVDMQVGLRSTRVRGVTFDVAGFWNRLENTLVKRTFTDAFGANVFVNSGDSRVRGLDVGARVDSQAFTGAHVNAFLRVAYGLADAQFTDGPVAGRRVPEVARHAGRASVGLEHTSGWSMSATVSHMGAFFTDEANTATLSALDPDEPLEIVGIVPSHTLVSARGTAPVPGTRWTLWVHGRNLGNRLYISDVQDGLRPGAGRTVSAGVRVRF